MTNTEHSESDTERNFDKAMQRLHRKAGETVTRDGNNHLEVDQLLIHSAALEAENKQLSTRVDELEEQLANKGRTLRQAYSLLASVRFCVVDGTLYQKICEFLSHDDGTAPFG